MYELCDWNVERTRLTKTQEMVGYKQIARLMQSISNLDFVVWEHTMESVKREAGMDREAIMASQAGSEGNFQIKLPR